MRAEAPLDRHIAQEAAVWLMQLQSGEADAGDWQRWCQRSEAHRQAGRRAEQLLQTLRGIPPALGNPSFERTDGLSRRAALKKLALLLGAGPLAWTAWQAAPLPDWRADARTARGERREIRLADGSALTLNTDSAIDMLFDTQLRRLRLRHGEIYIATAADPQQPARPFVVDTAQGRLRALGTRFAVRQFDGYSQLGVYEGAVEIRVAGGGEPVVVAAGQQARFDARGVRERVAADPAGEAWMRGILYADNQRLADFIAELSRYRAGVLRCAPEVADLRISGAYQLADTDRVLALLQQTFPVRVDGRHRWWLRLRGA